MENIREDLVDSPTRLEPPKHPGWLPIALPIAVAIGTVSSLIILVFAAIIGTEILLKKEIEPALDSLAALQKSHFDTYSNDRAFLAKAVFFHSALPNHAPQSLSSKLNEAFYWVPYSGYGRSQPLVASATRVFLLRYENEWIKSRSFLKKLQADLSIFDLVDALDPNTVWDLEAARPLAEIADKDQSLPKQFFPSDLPTPDTLDILSAVKVLLIQGTVDFAPIDALKKTRKLANLLLTSENFQLVTAGITALDLERRAYREYVDRGWLKAADWTPVDKNSTQRAHRAIGGTRGYLRLATSIETLKDIGLSDPPPPGFCAAVAEQLPVELSVESELTGRWPMERTYRPQFAILRKIAERAQKICRLRVFTRLLDDDVYRGESALVLWPFNHIPYFRTLFALRGWVATPKHFDEYTRRLRP